MNTAFDMNDGELLDELLDQLPPNDHNGGPEFSQEDLRRAGTEVGSTLADAAKADEKSQDAGSNAAAMRVKAAEHLFPIFDTIGLEPSWGKDFSKKAKEEPAYNTLQESACAELSRRLKDTVGETKQGKPVFSDRVKKAWSRLITSYKEGGNGGQTQADKDARAAEKLRKNRLTEMGRALQTIIEHAIKEDQDTVDALIDSAIEKFGGDLVAG